MFAAAKSTCSIPSESGVSLGMISKSGPRVCWSIGARVLVGGVAAMYEPGRTDLKRADTSGVDHFIWRQQE